MPPAPSSTMGDVRPERTVELIDELRALDVLSWSPDMTRKSTLLERLPLLPPTSPWARPARGSTSTARSTRRGPTGCASLRPLGARCR